MPLVYQKYNYNAIKNPTVFCPTIQDKLSYFFIIEMSIFFYEFVFYRQNLLYIDKTPVRFFYDSVR